MFIQESKQEILCNDIIHDTCDQTLSSGLYCKHSLEHHLLEVILEGLVISDVCRMKGYLSYICSDY